MHVIVSVTGCCVPPVQVPVFVHVRVKVLSDWQEVSELVQSVEVQVGVVGVHVCVRTAGSVHPVGILDVSVLVCVPLEGQGSGTQVV